MPYGYEGAYVIHGPPGCGKTSRVAATVRRIMAHPDACITEDHSPAIVGSLTKAAAAEAAGRDMLLHTRAVTTLHAHCLRSLDGDRDVVDAKAIAGDWNPKYPGLALSPEGAILGEDDDVVPKDVVGDKPGDTLLRDYELARHRMLPRAKWSQRVRFFVERWEKWKRETSRIDFTDMIELACAHWLSPGVIIMDEAQDLSRLELACLRRLQCAHGAALILVGDPYQALYTWRGACPHLLTHPETPAGQVDMSTLNQSYRVPAAAHRKAVQWIRLLSDHKPIEYLPRREDPSDPTSPVVQGAVVRCSATWTDPEQAILEAATLAGAGKSVLLLTTTNRMTLPICRVLRAQGLPFSNPWRRRERKWNPLWRSKRTSMSDRVRALIAFDADSHAGWTYGEAWEWIQPLRSRGEGFLASGARAAIRARKDEDWLGPKDAEALFVPGPFSELLDRLLEGDHVGALDVWLRHLSAARRKAAGYAVCVVRKHGCQALAREPLIYPSTIHASKGGQADHVFLFPDLSRAADEAWLDGGEGRDSVVRAFYVAMTRAREGLHLCEPAGRRFVEL